MHASLPDRHRPRYHFTAPTNWINASNGVCFHNGRYHLYYQYNPAACHWGYGLDASAHVEMAVEQALNGHVLASLLVGRL